MSCFDRLKISGMLQRNGNTRPLFNPGLSLPVSAGLGSVSPLKINIPILQRSWNFITDQISTPKCVFLWRVCCGSSRGGDLSCCSSQMGEKGEIKIDPPSWQVGFQLSEKLRMWCKLKNEPCSYEALTAAQRQRCHGSIKEGQIRFAQADILSALMAILLVLISSADGSIYCGSRSLSFAGCVCVGVCVCPLFYTLKTLAGVSTWAKFE